MADGHFRHRVAQHSGLHAWVGRRQRGQGPAAVGELRQRLVVTNSVTPTGADDKQSPLYQLQLILNQSLRFVLNGLLSKMTITITQ